MRPALWDTVSWERVATLDVSLTGRTRWVGSQRFALDASRSIGAFCGIGSVRIFDLVSGRHLGNVGGGGALGDAAVVMSGDGDLLVTMPPRAANGGDARIWRREQPEPIGVLEGAAGSWRDLVLTTDGGRAVGATNGGLAVWDATSGRMLATLAGSLGVREMLVGGDCVVGVSGPEPPSRIGARVGPGKPVIRAWEIPRRASRRQAEIAPVAEVSSHRAPISAVVLLPHQGAGASADADGIVLRWSLDGGAVIGESVRHGSGIRCLAAAADGEWLAGGGSDGSVVVWPSSGRPPTPFRADAAITAVTAIDGSTLVAGDALGGVHVLRVGSGPPR
jgi:WD40 repeat protein